MPILGYPETVQLSQLMRKGTTENRWYIAGMQNGTALATTAGATNQFHAMPQFFAKRVNVDSIAANCTGTAAANIRLGIYKDDGNLYPSTLIFDSGAISTSSTGFKTSTVSEPLSQGLYWFTIIFSGAPTMRTFAAVGSIPIGGLSGVTAASAAGSRWLVTQTYGALPSTFPGSAALGGTTVFAVYFRLT